MDTDVVRIRPMMPGDREEVAAMMKVFYGSDAVLTNGSEAIFRADIDACLDDDAPVDGFVFDDGGSVAGYAMAVRSFSTELGGICIWLEDLYLKPEYRGQGLGTCFFAFLEQQYPDAVSFRMEAEPGNERALAVYRENGYRVLPYTELIKSRG